MPIYGRKRAKRQALRCRQHKPPNMLIFLAFLVNFIIGSVSQLNISYADDWNISEDDYKYCRQRTKPNLKEGRHVVLLSLEVLDIDQIREDNMEFRLHCYVLLKWYNEKIQVQITNHNRPINLPVEFGDCMWKPDVIFPNAKETETFVDTLPNKGYKYLPSKMFFKVERFIMRISCPMEFAYYPLDTQHCVIKFGLMFSSDEEVMLKWDIDGKRAINFAYPFQPLKFRIINPVTFSKTEEWATGNFTELWANITLHRRLTGSVINVFLPSSLVVVLSWLSFWIDADAAPARVTLGVTALLTITTLMIQSRNVLPPVQYVTGLDVWLFACLSLVFASFIEYSVAYTFRANLNNIIKPTTGQISVVNINRESAKSSKIEPLRKGTGVKSLNPLMFVSNRFDKISRTVFPMIMIAFALVYWAYLLIATRNN